MLAGEFHGGGTTDLGGDRIVTTKRDAPLFTGSPDPHKDATVRTGERLPLTTELRARESGRLLHSPYGATDKALVRALGRQFRYLRQEHVDAFYPRAMSRNALGRHLAQLWRCQWINWESASGTGLKHPPKVYRLGRLGADWLRLNQEPARWTVDTKGLKGGLDDRQPHWLGLADVWYQLHTLTVLVPTMTLAQFETELDFPYGRLDDRSRFRPDAFFILSWGPSRHEHYLAYVEYDRATESVPQFYRGKVANGQHFAASPRWPWSGDTVDYWIFAPTQARVQALAQGLRTGPFGDAFASWVLIPGFQWMTRSGRAFRIPDWRTIRDPRYSPEDSLYGPAIAYPRLLTAIAQLPRAARQP